MNFFDIPLELSAQHRQDLLDFETKYSRYYYQHDYTTGEYFGLNLLLESSNIPKDSNGIQTIAFKGIRKVNPEGTFSTPDSIKKIIEMFLYQPVRWSFAKINKRVHLPTHIDGDDNRSRNTIIVFPLQPYDDRYAPCDIMRFPNSKKPIQRITFRPCYAFSTECWHRVKNNKYCRKSLQLWYGDHIETLYEKFQQGQLLKKD